jgi:hypothetical protein
VDLIGGPPGDAIRRYAIAPRLLSRFIIKVQSTHSSGFAGVKASSAVNKQCFLKIYEKARGKVITNDNTISGFRGSGIWLIDVEKKPSAKIAIISKPPSQNPFFLRLNAKE